VSLSGSHEATLLIIATLTAWRNSSLKLESEPLAITVRTSARVPIYPADVVLSADGFLPSVPTVKTAGTGLHGPKSTWIRDCADVARTHKDTRRVDAVKHSWGRGFRGGS
jgi:hypothetical protein